MPKYYNDKYKNLISSFLEKDPKNRPTAKEALNQIPEIVKTNYSNLFKFKESEDKSGGISSRNSSLKKSTDLPIAIIPIPQKKQRVKLDIR